MTAVLQFTEWYSSVCTIGTATPECLGPTGPDRLATLPEVADDACAAIEQHRAERPAGPMRDFDTGQREEELCLLDKHFRLVTPAGRTMPLYERDAAACCPTASQTCRHMIDLLGRGS
jgi:hypothetical protein